MPRFVFALPDHDLSLACLIRAVPDGWSWVDGYLQAPASMVESGEASRNIRISLRRFAEHGFELFSNGRDKETGQVIHPDLHAFLFERKRPIIVAFDEAGFMRTGGLTLGGMKHIAASFVGMGYRGHLHFFSDCRNNNKYDNPARCELWMVDGDWKIMLAYDELHGGRVEDLTDLRNACNRLKLRMIGSCS